MGMCSKREGYLTQMNLHNFHMENNVRYLTPKYHWAGNANMLEEVELKFEKKSLKNPAFCVLGCLWFSSAASKF